MRMFLGAIALVLVGCASQQFPNSHTAYEQYSRLDRHDKAVAGQFYELGQGDTVKRLYWAQRRAQETGSAAAAPSVSLERRYVNIPVPEHVDPDGTVKEATNQVVEVVQFWAVTKSHGRKLFVVK
jgi:hypothetical protein